MSIPVDRESSKDELIEKVRAFNARKGVTFPTVLEPAFTARYGLHPAGSHLMLFGRDGKLLEIGHILSLRRRSGPLEQRIEQALASP